MAGNLRTVKPSLARVNSPREDESVRLDGEPDRRVPIFVGQSISRAARPTPFVVLISRQGDGSGVLPSGEMS